MIFVLSLYSKSVPIAKAKESAGKQLQIKGWIYRKRSSGGKLFAVLQDLTGTIQCIVDKSTVGEKEWAEIEKAYLESSIIVKGSVRKDARAPGGFELDVKELRIVHSGEQFPITEYQSAEFLLDVRHLWLRSRKMRLIMEMRSHVFKYLREFLDKKKFFEITPPLLTSSGGETGANMFEVQYFERKAYLTESSQLYAEAMVPALERVYSFAPSWRAEKSRTTKHLAEYWHLEPEMAYFDNKRNMALQERLISHVAGSLLKRDEEILKELDVQLDPLKKIKPPFNRLSYEKSVELLQQKGSKIQYGTDFGVEEERLLTEDEEKPMFIYNWPREIKAFYMPVNRDGRTVACADLQAPHGHGEIIGGSERIWKLDELVARMDEMKLNKVNYKWYIDLRRYGSVPHAGFGLGVERTIKWMLNLEHIRDAIPFPRMMNRVEP